MPPSSQRRVWLRPSTSSRARGTRAASGPRASLPVNQSQDSPSQALFDGDFAAKLSSQNKKDKEFRPNKATSAINRFTGRTPSPRAPSAAAMPASKASRHGQIGRASRRGGGGQAG